MQEFGAAMFGDVRRTRRAVDMTVQAARQPAGKVSAVFNRSKDREGAYDFLESPLAPVSALTESMCTATAERARGERVVYVPVDLTSLTLTDLEESKFGPIGSPNKPVRGLMVVNVFAVAMDGVPLGLIDQQYWMREETETLDKDARTKRNRLRAFEDKQGSRFTSAAENAVRRLDSTGVHPWIIIDREGDNRDIILKLAEMRCVFTVRASWDRRVGDKRSDRTIRELLEDEPSLGEMDVLIPRNGSRQARAVTVEVRASRAEIRFDRPGSPASLELYAVLVREKGRRGAKQSPIDWLLYTNVPVTRPAAAVEILAAYRARWRIEEFHRTWKAGACNVETAQLRSFEAVAKWATILSAVATRIERLKYLARNKPDEPVSIELQPLEIEALLVERRSRLKGKRSRLLDIPTVGEATAWIAEMGGWMGEKRSGPPGSVTIARGLQVLAIYTQAISDYRAVAASGPPK